MTLKVVNVPIHSLYEYEGNAKIHTQDQIDKIAHSIEEFGNNDPIAAWHDENGDCIIIEGHGRLAALKKLGYETAPVIFLDHLTDQQRKAYTHIHNQLTMDTGFDLSILDDELSKITDIDMSDYGFVVSQILDQTEDQVQSIIDATTDFDIEDFPLKPLTKAFILIACPIEQEDGLQSSLSTIIDQFPDVEIHSQRKE